MDNWNVAPEPDLAEYPNTVKRRRLSSARGDDMAGTGAAAGTAAAGDASSFPRSPRAPSATSKSQATAGNDSVGGDVNTCRICRGEGTHDEPLFYPCKCSGSIKFVHQDCLMEWLSHSQRKHCELCKTPFRFTKLYSPDMPKSLPFYVFASHMAKYLFRNVLVWLRAVLVISVWLGWLPWIMRSVWSFLFWISDEGLGPLPPYLLEGERNATAAHVDFVANTVASQGLTTTVCPSTPLLPATTTAANKLVIAQNMPKFLRAFGQSVRLSNSSTNSLIGSVSRILFGGPPSAAEQTQMISLANVTQAGSHGARHVQPSSLLGDVSFLKNLTRHARLNKTIIAVLEGQIITVLVIVCFILIILVRDYVVQQQPEINMRAAFAAQENNGHDGPVAVPPPDHFGPADEDSETESETDDEDDTHVHDEGPAIAHTGIVGRNAAMVDGETNDPNPAALPLDGPGEPPEPPRQRPIAGYRRRLVRRDTADGTEGTSSATGTTPPPSQPAEPRDNQMQPGVQTPTVVSQYLRIYREAGGDPETILRMIREEGLEERLASYVNATRAMPGATDDDESNGSPLQPPPRSTVSHTVPLEMSGAQTGQADTVADAKGKGKATDDNQQAPEGQAIPSQPSQDTGASSATPALLFPSSPSSSSARPRSVSDGPQHQGSVNPLANGTWSFSNLPSQPQAGDDDVDTTSGSGQKTPSTTAASGGGSAVPENWDDAIQAEPHQEPQDDRPEDDGLWSDVDSMVPEAPGDEDAGEFAGHIHDDIQPELVVPREPGGLVDRVADFMWGDVDAGDGDDGPGAIELFLDDGDAPFMEANRDAGGLGEEDGVELAPDVVEAAAAAGIDPEALEDAEDFEGIMELVGMRGPIAGLVQNAIFCGFLVIITIFLGIFIPYNIGRLAVWIVANPARILQMILSFSKFVQDVLLLAVGWTTRCVLEVVSVTRVLFRVAEGRQLLETAAADARTLTTTSLNRIIGSFASDFPLISSSEVRNFSAISHQALIDVKGQIYTLLSAAVSAVVFVLGGDYMAKWTTLASTATAAAPVAWETVKNIVASVARPSSWVISLNLSETASTVDSSLAYWGAKDRTFAILGGYIAICLVAGLYLSRGTPFSSSPTGQEWEASIIDALNQASGVMKVILIISIEMLIFPLYCGLLLDFALLPLFESASFKSRLMFTYNFPLTSIFVHWFVGTGYMFHFALFVSMCRKIMRKGVLCKLIGPVSHNLILTWLADFIRDPDDPEFHPVRDVLERNVTTQLRKILFSAFVYGALVVICLGGVVWGLSLALPNVLPIHYSSNEPVLEFPIDLLFYNFLMPLAVKFFKPSDGLHAMYTWWFRKCARTLRLTWFLFGERRIDEEGNLRLAPGVEDEHKYPWYRTVFLQVSKRNKVVPKTWADMFEAGQTKPVAQMNADELAGLNAIKTSLVDSGQLIPDGRFVRTPASDQVKIPKGQPVFLAVTERNSRMDGRPERPDSDLYTGPHYQFAYLPPHFRTRISLFILFIWLFAAVTGVGFTIVPLVFGRFMFKKLIPAHIRTNDIYAFSIGAYILGSLGYLAFHARAVASKLQSWALTAAASLFGRDGLDRIAAVAVKTAKVGYTYTMLLVVFPLLTTLLMELYVLIPLHTWIHYTMMTMEPTPFPALAEGHTIRVIQAWTLGILYLKLGSRALLYQGGRPAQAVRAVLRKGWLDPDVGVLTRAFVLPGLVVAGVMILSPPAVTRLFVTSWDYHGMGVVMFRMSYPLAAMMWAGAYLCRSLLYVLDGWHARVRDEAYLMGERLHNFGGLVGVGAKGANNRGEWRNGARL